MIQSTQFIKSSTSWSASTSPTRHERIRTRTPRLSLPFIGLTLLICYATMVDFTRAMAMTYCSPDNTAGTAANLSIYQSDGLCYNFCINDYAYAVVLYQSCWCTNYAPAEQMSLEDCVDPCPGYQSDLCGNSADTYYGYIQLSLPASGTLGTSSNTPISTVRSTTSDPPASLSISISSVAVPTTVTVQQTQDTSTSDTPTTTAPATTSSSSDKTSSTFTPTPFISVITLVGSAHTITVTPTSPSDMTAQSSSASTSQIHITSESKGSGFFSNTGRAAGVFTALALVLIALTAACVFFCLRRKRQGGTRYDSDTPESAHSRSSPVLGGARKTRSSSTLGMVAPFSSDKQVPSILTTGPGGYATPVEPRLTDQRLDPQQVWMRFENDNSSRVSIRSLRDDTDYSRRVLKVLNPDD